MNKDPYMCHSEEFISISIILHATYHCIFRHFELQMAAFFTCIGYI